jgi:SAM-dependent methyltransferase
METKTFVDETTRRRLNAINNAFYQRTARSFDETRGQAWAGWSRLLPHLKAYQHLSVLDVGCGNGRFGLFLADNVKFPDAEAHISNSDLSPQHSALLYHGIDNNPTLLELAREKLAGVRGIAVILEARDIVENPPDAGEYLLVAAFGVLHHLPGFEQRQQLVQSLAQRVAPGGLLAFACWRFYEYERFRARIGTMPSDLRVERHDYLLDWRRDVAEDDNPPLRYCHYVDDDEQAELVAATGLTEIETYRADGASGDMNRYTILRK